MQDIRQHSDYFGTEKISRILFRMAPPVMLAQLIQALYNIIDSVFVGRYSESGLTALSIVYPLQLLMIALAVGTGVGINTVMAAKLGLSQSEKADEYAGTGTPLAGKGEYPAYLACNLFTEKHSLYVGEEGAPRVMQDGRDGDEDTGYIGNITNGATAGFKYFECKGVSRFWVTARGYAKGVYEVRTKWDGDILAKISVELSNVWETYSVQVDIPDGVNAIYLTFRGDGNGMLKSFALE